MFQRQSCDRCHQQKVRCIRSPQLLNTSVDVSSCARCIKAGASCVYSRKSISNSTIEEGSKCESRGIWYFGSAHEELSTPGVAVAALWLTDGAVKQKPGRAAARSCSHTPLPPCNMSAVLPYPTSSSSKVDSTHASMDYSPETEYQNETATFDSFQSASNCMDFLDDHSNWDLGSYSSHELPSFTLFTQDSQTTPSRTANNSRDMEMASKNQEETHQRHPEANPARQQLGNQPKAFVEQLAELNISLFRSAQHIASPDSPPLTVVSPHVEGLFEATILVIKIVGTLIPKLSSSRSSPIEAFGTDVDLQLPNTDNDLIFLVLACRQQLLGVFRTVCQSIQRNMGCLAGDVTGPSPGPDGRLSDPESYTTRDFSVSATLNGGGAPSMAQFSMVMQLLSYLLNRLNHAFDLVGDDLDLLDDGDTRQASGQREQRVHSEQPQEVEMSSEGLGVCPLRHQWRSNAPRPGWHGITETAVESIRYQHISLQQEIEILQKRIVGSTF